MVDLAANGFPCFWLVGWFEALFLVIQGGCFLLESGAMGSSEHKPGFDIQLGEAEGLWANLRVMHRPVLKQAQNSSSNEGTLKLHKQKTPRHQVRCCKVPFERSPFNKNGGCLRFVGWKACSLEGGLSIVSAAQAPSESTPNLTIGHWRF